MCLQLHSVCHLSSSKNPIKVNAAIDRWKDPATTLISTSNLTRTTAIADIAHLPSGAPYRLTGRSRPVHEKIFQQMRRETGATDVRRNPLRQSAPQHGSAHRFRQRIHVDMIADNKSRVRASNAMGTMYTTG